MKNQQNETNNPSEKKNDIYSLLIKYLEMIDSKIYKTAALPRFLSIFSDFKKYLSDSFDSFYEYIDLTLENKVIYLSFVKFVIITEAINFELTELYSSPIIFTNPHITFSSGITSSSTIFSSSRSRVDNMNASFT